MLDGTPSRCRVDRLLRIACWDREKGKEMAHLGRSTRITIDCKVSSALSDPFFATSGRRTWTVATVMFPEVGLQAQRLLYYILC